MPCTFFAAAAAAAAAARASIFLAGLSGVSGRRASLPTSAPRVPRLRGSAPGAGCGARPPALSPPSAPARLGLRRDAGTTDPRSPSLIFTETTAASETRRQTYGPPERRREAFRGQNPSGIRGTRGAKRDRARGPPPPPSRAPPTKDPAGAPRARPPTGATRPASPRRHGGN